jgi:hypothetical protein
VGRPGIAGLLDLMLDTSDEEWGAEEEEPPESAPDPIEPGGPPSSSTAGLSQASATELPQLQEQKPAPPLVSGREAGGADF